jgi:long-subunit fatty acid transport protein
MKEQQDEKHLSDTTQRLKRATRRHYYLGGQFSGSKGTHNGTVTGRFGTFLYKDRWDVSLALNLGYVKNDAFQFTGSVGLDTRTYFPIPKIHLAPYVGGGIFWTFAPTKYVEIRGLIGTCLFIGSGSLDMGLQYGLNSKLSFTAGYTFSPAFKNRKR